MFTVHDIQGELQVSNKPREDLPSVMFNMADGKYYQWTPSKADGELTGYWKEVTEPTGTSGFMNVDGIWYQWTPTTVDGTVTGTWNEVEGPDRILNPQDGKYYRWVLSIVDGEMTGYWQEAT